MDNDTNKSERVKKLCTKEEEVNRKNVFVKEENEKMRNLNMKKEELFTYKCG